MTKMNKMFLGICMIIDGIIKVVTFGTGNTSFALNFCKYDAKRRSKRIKTALEDL